MTHYVYFFGDAAACLVKVGETEDDLAGRLRAAEKDYNRRFHFLAAVVGTRAHEQDIVRRRWRAYSASADFIGREEAFRAVPETVEYVAWLRRQWFTTTEIAESLADPVDYERWAPRSERRWLPDDRTAVGRFFSPDRVYTGPLAGSAWDWMLPEAQADDWYTNLDLFSAMSTAVGGFDLDAASHPIANRRLRVPDYYEVRRSGLAHPWRGDVYLAPPGGARDPWLRRALTETVASVTMLLPAWSLFRSSGPSREVVGRADLIVMFNPPPPFWGPSSGTRHPYAVVHLGPHGEALAASLAVLGGVALRPLERSGVPA